MVAFTGDITPETTISLQALGLILTGIGAIMAFFLGSLRKNSNKNAGRISLLLDEQRKFHTSVTERLQGIENRIDGAVSARVLQRWAQTLQKKNPAIDIPVMDFWDGKTED